LEHSVKKIGINFDDASLIRDFKAGNRGAFNYLVLKYQDGIVSICFRFLGDYQEASDCAQDVFLKAFKALKKFEFKSTFFTWLYRIAINTCETKLRSSEQRYKKRTVSLDNPGTAERSNPSRTIVDNSPSPIEQLEHKERSIMLQDAINSLSKDHKTMIILRDIEQLSYEEIAITTGIELGTVKSRIARARIELRNKLKEQ